MFGKKLLTPIARCNFVKICLSIFPSFDVWSKVLNLIRPGLEVSLLI